MLRNERSNSWQLPAQHPLLKMPSRISSEKITSPTHTHTLTCNACTYIRHITLARTHNSNTHGHTRMQTHALTHAAHSFFVLKKTFRPQLDLPLRQLFLPKEYNFMLDSSLGLCR